MEIFIDTLHILQCDLLPEHHLVKCANEERIQEASVEDGKSNNTTDKFKVVQMFGVDARVRVYLEGIIVVSRVFKKAIKGIEHFVREKEKVLPGKVSRKAKDRGVKVLHTVRVHRNPNHLLHQT